MSFIRNFTGALILHLENMYVFIAKFGLEYGFICSGFCLDLSLSLTGFGLNVDLFGEKDKQVKLRVNHCDDKDRKQRMTIF